MKDVSLNQFFSIHSDDNTGDIGTVEGREAFEQAVVVLLNRLQLQDLGESSQTVPEKVRQKVTRVAAYFDEIESVSDLSVHRSNQNQTTIVVEIVYDTGGYFQEQTNL
jgi:uncharacterized protein with HEPN domain